MCDSAEMPFLSPADLTIVPCPQREAWAVVNRCGDTLAVGAYPDCVHHLARLTASPTVR
jgi:hypothetical protein